MMVGCKYQRAILEDHREESLHEGSGGCVGWGIVLTVLTAWSKSGIIHIGVLDGT